MKPTKKNLLYRLLLLTLLCCAVLPSAVFADDQQAAQLYQEGRELYNNEEYRDAAKKFEEARFMADSASIRANSLLAQINSYRMCGLYYQEFLAIETLLDRHMEYADYKAMVDREFEIGDEFLNGKREPAFWAFRWVPWLVDIDRTEEVYSKALKRSPYAKQAPGAMFRLAYWYEMNDDMKKSLEVLKKLVADHPDAPENKYALLALGNGLFELAKTGDGDGRYTNAALDVFREYERRYPKSDELAFAKRKIAASRDVQAERLSELAEYYRKSGRPDTATRYLARVMQHYPDSEKAPSAERKLLELDDTYIPGDFAPRPEARLPQVHTFSIPDEAEDMLISPLDNNSFLLPVPDLQSALSAEKALETRR